MKNYYFQYDLTTNKIYPLLQDTTPQVQGMGLLGPYPQDTASEDVVMAYNYPDRYLVQNGQLIKQSYFTLTDNNGTLTAILNNPPATVPMSCTFSVLEQSITEALTNNTATITLTMHPAVANQSFQVNISAAGCVQATAQIGGTASGVPLQAYQDSSNNWHIAPMQKSVLQAYYASVVPSQIVPANMLAAVSLLSDVVFNVLATPAAVSALTADQQNAINDFKANILPHLPITLANAYPANGSREIHYASLEVNMPTYAQSVNGYNADLASIPNLT